MQITGIDKQYVPLGEPHGKQLLAIANLVSTAALHDKDDFHKFVGMKGGVRPEIQTAVSPFRNLGQDRSRASSYAPER